MTRAGFVLLLAFAVPVAAIAWTNPAEERIARKAAILAPPDLRTLLDKFEPEYLAGLDRARAEGEAQHRFGSGRLAERIEAESRATVAMIRRGDPMTGIVERLGVLAHLVGDANNPFHASGDARLAPMQADYESFAARSVGKVPTIFYGLQRDFRPSVLTEGMKSRSARFAPLLAAEYFRDGRRRTSAEFDDRSTAFGIASITYSRSVSDLINLYYFIWKESGGDVRNARSRQRSNLLLNEH
ncbi:MAG: hypothetical protein WA208_17510 [Thermoanaerobaculia bacterium]